MNSRSMTRVVDKTLDCCRFPRCRLEWRVQQWHGTSNCLAASSGHSAADTCWTAAQSWRLQNIGYDGSSRRRTTLAGFVALCHGLRDISKAVVVLTKLLYASPAWWGFATSADKQRLEAFLRRGVRLNLYSALNPSVSCSVAVPPTLHVIFIMTATPLFLLVAVAIGLEYNAAHSCCRG